MFDKNEVTISNLNSFGLNEKYKTKFNKLKKKEKIYKDNLNVKILKDSENILKNKDYIKLKNIVQNYSNNYYSKIDQLPVKRKDEILNQNLNCTGTCAPLSTQSLSYSHRRY